LEHLQKAGFSQITQCSGMSGMSEAASGRALSACELARWRAGCAKFGRGIDWPKRLLGRPEGLDMVVGLDDGAMLACVVCGGISV
jgi:hypothetical protein